MLLVLGVHLSLIGQGYVGVDIFFVLSSFLITVLLLEEHERIGAMSLLRFYDGRARRLLPALATLLVAFTMLCVIVDPYPSMWPLGRVLLTTSTFANNWVATLAAGRGQVLGPLSPTWTLAEEVQFYAIWPLALWLALRLRVSEPKLLLLVVGICAASFVSAQYLRDAYPVYNGYTSPLDRASELLLGCAVALIWRNGWASRPLRFTAARWIAAAGLAFVIAYPGLGERFSYLSAALLSGLLIVNLLSTDEHEPDRRGPAPTRRAGRPVLSRVVSSRPLRYAGKLSYGIYLYHLPVYYLLWHYLPGRSHVLYAPIVLVATFALAAASWRAIESPIYRRRPGSSHQGSPRARLQTRRLRSTLEPRPTT